jgi:hypothetical protein
MPGTLALADADLLLVNPAFADVSGTTITISQPGRYVFLAVFDFDWTVAGAATAQGIITATGATASSVNGVALSDGGVVNRKTVPVFGWATYAAAGGTVKLQATKAAAAGTGFARFSALATSLLAIRTGPA